MMRTVKAQQQQQQLLLLLVVVEGVMMDLEKEERMMTRMLED